MEHKRKKTIPAKQEYQSTMVKKSTAKAARGSWVKCLMPGVQLPPEEQHRSSESLSPAALVQQTLDKLGEPVCRAEGGAKELPAARTP